MKAIRFEGRKIDAVNLGTMDIRDQTKALQRLIGGYIEVVRIADDAAMLVDEDGYCKCLPPNPAASLFAGRLILGTALVVGIAENEDEELYFTDCPKRFGLAKENA